MIYSEQKIRKQFQLNFISITLLATNSNESQHIFN